MSVRFNGRKPETVSFEKPFNGGQDVKVFVSKSHTTKNYSGGDGAAIWVESVDNKEFTVSLCFRVRRWF
ncbi:unnamed protein product [Porites lobata]|uniref:Uncharacterized protein n=1 Tax=Porites lobata TaxID=104759 RepID=A0ABN8S231_9CNID|nr:unnamed protein product [Porites lobata]